MFLVQICEIVGGVGWGYFLWWIYRNYIYALERRIVGCEVHLLILSCNLLVAFNWVASPRVLASRCSKLIALKVLYTFAIFFTPYHILMPAAACVCTRAA